MYKNNLFFPMAGFKRCQILKRYRRRACLVEGRLLAYRPRHVVTLLYWLTSSSAHCVFFNSSLLGQEDCGNI